MTVVALGWCISALLAVLALTASAITWAPPASLARVFPTIFGFGAVLAAGVSIAVGRLPPEHWVKQSRPVWFTCASVAATLTVLILILG